MGGGVRGEGHSSAGFAVKTLKDGRERARKVIS